MSGSGKQSKNESKGKCDKCKKENSPNGETTVKWLQCDECEKWLHAECEEITKEQYRMLTELQNTCSLTWKCNKCEKRSKKIEEKGNNAKNYDQIIKRMNEMFEQLTEKIEYVNNNIGKEIKNTSSTLEESLLKTMQSTIQEELAPYNKRLKDLEERISQVEINSIILPQEFEERLKMLENRKTPASKEIEERINQLETSKPQANKEFEELNQKVQIIETKITKVPQEDTEKYLEAQINENLSEMMAREKKARNIVVFGMPEIETETNQSIQNWIERNFDLHNNKPEVKEVFRMGKKVLNRNRPLKIKFTEIGLKKTILTQAKAAMMKQEKETGNRIYICPDQTLKQREEQRNLRSLLQQKRKEGGSWKIERNRVVRNPTESTTRREEQASRETPQEQ